VDRKTYIGGGAIAAVVNNSPYKTALQLWEALTSDEDERLDPKQERFFRRRKALEGPILTMLREDHDVVPTKVSFDHEPNRYKDPAVPYFAAEIDYETVMTPALVKRFYELRDVPTGDTINGEIKTASPFDRGAWGEDENDIPPHVAAQVQWGLGVTGRRACLVSPLFGVDELPVVVVLRDQVTINWLRRCASEFWALVQQRRPPEPKPRDLDDLRRYAARLVGVPVELNDEAFAALQTIQGARQMISGLEEDENKAKHTLFEFIRKAWGVPADPTVDFPIDNGLLQYKGKTLAVWRRQIRSTVDAKLLAAEMPMVYHNYRRESVHRVLAKPPKERK